MDGLELLKSLIACPSVTPDPAGTLEILEAALIPLGFTCQRLTFEGDNSYPVANLFATRDRGGRHLLFAGHTDVVAPGPLDLWTTPPFTPAIRDGKLYGRGAVDMKSGIAAFIAALDGALPDVGTISLAITNDEEADSVNGTDKILRWAEAQGIRFDFAIVGEPSAKARTGDSIKVGRRGSWSGRVTVTGRQGHVAHPDKALNPLPVLAAIAVALKAEPIDGGTALFPPSNLELTTIDVGNSTGNVIPAAGSLRFNIRFNDSWTPSTMRGWVERRIATVPDRGCTVTLEQVSVPSHSFLSPRGGDVDRLISSIARVTGETPELSTSGGTSDARFIARLCPVVEFGLPGPSLHQVDEHVILAEFHTLVAAYAAIVQDFFRPAP
jgi:succinyl-diaminopimelate desuccinylase